MQQDVRFDVTADLTRTGGRPVTATSL